MADKKYIVNLGETLPEEFTIAIYGKKEGKKQRRIWKLDKVEKKYDNIEINIDPKYEFMSVSFIQGMFSKSIEKMGKEEFYNKYSFVCDEHIKETIANEMMFMDLNLCDYKTNKKKK